jgi:ribonuclease HII
VTPHHRRSFAPVRRALEGMSAISTDTTAAGSAWDD